ncbi:site-specific integrase [Pseudomonas fluorescens]|uniref:Tyrosine recombinase XerD n=1 Tax=Pseudomonas fluorescens TaxID=294 RepID=A0A5E7ETP6_PSEFL|nr:site-specific integrase [Pseudomonas fluorescens]VVO30189.1 Tyrosine recombinase XerD [Pseudomonas fluorescens]
MSIIALSAKKLKSLSCPPGKAKENVWDSGCKGLMLELRESGGKTWYLRYVTPRGKQRQFRLGDASVISLEQARKRSDELRGQIALGNDPLDAKKVLKQVPTFAVFVQERYMPFIKGYKRSWHIDESLLRNHLLPVFGKLYLDEITKDDVTALHLKRRATGGAPASANRLLILMRYIFNLAVRWETPGVLKNPTIGIPLFEENNKRERYLSPEEASRLYGAIQASDSKMLKFIIPMLIFTGARKREVLDARWSDFDTVKRVWRIAISKSGKVRHVPLSSSVLELLAEVKKGQEGSDKQPADNEWVFANPDSGKPYVQIYYAWDTARKRAGLLDFRIHDLRHTFASFLINAGRSLYEVQKILGHTQIKTTQRYSHLSQDTLLAAANTAVEALGQSFAMTSQN